MTTTADLIKQKLGLEKGSGASGSEWVGSISMKDVVEIAKQIMEKSMAKTLKACVKEVVGTCLSMGVLVENKNPKEVIKEIDSGVYDDLIKE